ncbi:MAG: helix-turn-helix transcriptional regulator [Bacteroidaceae bacterium]|nr:helix-turn-helix transcriptional regulator [Bacteroidaceae bacterium]
MEQLDVLLLLTRAVAMSFFLMEALHLLIYWGKTRLFRMFAIVQLLMGTFFLLTIISDYFSSDPQVYNGHLNLLWNMTVPAIIVMLFELLKGRRMRRRYIIASFLPFILFFLVYSVNNNQDFLRIVNYLTLGYATLSVLVLQVMMVKEVNRHDVVSEKHAYVWFAVVMWAMYSSLFIRVVMSYIDIQLSKIITMVVLVVVYAIVSYLLRHGMLDFHSLRYDESEPDLEQEPPAINTPRQSSVQTRPIVPAPERKEMEPLYMQEQMLFYGDKARQLNDVMEAKRLYLNPDLTVADIATELGTNRTYVSNLINQYLNTTFSNYVNAYRVRYAKKLLLKTDDTIEEIYQESGFQSRTTFWRAFAQIAGCTPKEYRRKAALNGQNIRNGS